MAVRKDIAAWQLLQRMNQPEAVVIFDAMTGHFRFMLHSRAMETIDRRSIEALDRVGYLTRERSTIPVLVVSARGQAALRRQADPADLVTQTSR